MFKRPFFALLMLASLSARAQDRQFPYKAEVVVDETYVRSGGGEKFYPTLSLKRGATVNVLRHDPGGWCMIQPPKGSFSWVPSRFVQSVKGATGETVDDSVVVFVGSAFGEETSVWQRRLQPGEKVKIIGQETVDTVSGPVQMYKIQPPAREFRWIPGTAIVPIDRKVREARDRNPYQVPTEIARRRVTRQQPASTTFNTAPSSSAPAFSPSRQLARLRRIREEQRSLQELDQQFRFMIMSPPSDWDLDRLEQDYLKLQQKITHKPLAGQIDLRYPAIYRYRQKKAKIDQFDQLTTETEKRDSELLAQQFGMNTTQTARNAPPLSSNVPQFAFGQPGIPLDGGLANSNPSLPIPDGNFLSAAPVAPAPNGDSVAATPSTGVPSLKLPSNAKYIGAGFLQRGPEGNSNEYLLTSPAGKVLARLTRDGDVDFEKYVGTSVGLQGKRWFDPEARTDRIEVSGLEPVRIRN